ncbi:MAG: phage terminase large subunit, partial [Anaerolineales bacterium]
DDIEIGRPESFDKVLLSVDPAVSTKKTADFSAFAVVGISDQHIYVIHTEQLRGSPDELRAVTERLIKDYGVQLVLWEKNYGDSLWKAVLDGVKCKVRFIRNTDKKEARITQSLDAYKRGKVKHSKSMLSLEEQMTSFPNVRHDDLIDAVATAVNYFSSNRTKPRVKQASYI